MPLSCRFKSFTTIVLILFSFPASSFTLNWQQAFEQHHVIMLLIRPGDGQIVKANRAASQFYGYPVGQLESMTIHHINALSKKATADEMVLAKEENRNYFIFPHRLANNELRTVEVSSIPTIYNGEILLYSIIRDISEFKEAQQGLWDYQNRLEDVINEQAELLNVRYHQQVAILLVISLLLIALSAALARQMLLQRKTKYLLEKEKNRLSDVIWGANVGTWKWKVDSDKLVVSDLSLSLIGYESWPLNSLSMNRTRQLCHQSDWDNAHFNPENIINVKGEDDFYESEVRVRHKKGYWVWILVRGRVMIRDKNTNLPLVVVGTYQEISKQKEMHEKLYEYAHMDLLAEVPNRRSFNQCLESLRNEDCDGSLNHVLFYLDLNKFKDANDQFGHKAGDQIIKNVGHRLKKLFRSSDHIFRVGGDEFTILLKNIECTSVINNIAEKVIKALSEPHQLENGLTAVAPPSIGVAVYPKDSSNADTLICQADQMMYLAKNRYPTGGYEVYTPEKFVISAEYNQPRYC
ncbi:diguanylate cyclase [Vibrio alginolyticus]